MTSPFSILPLTKEAPRATWTPPASFLEPSQPIERVQLRRKKYHRRSGNSEARERGLRFEERVQEHLSEAFPTSYIAEPELVYWTGKGPRNGFPDGVLELPDRLVVFEMKIQHMPEAWWQLRKHYQPVLEAYTKVPVQCVEIVKDFDLQMPFPEDEISYYELRDLDKLLVSDPHDFAVLWWPR